MKAASPAPCGAPSTLHLKHPQLTPTPQLLHSPVSLPGMPRPSSAWDWSPHSIHLSLLPCHLSLATHPNFWSKQRPSHIILQPRLSWGPPSLPDSGACVYWPRVPGMETSQGRSSGSPVTRLSQALTYRGGSTGRRAELLYCSRCV